MGTITQEFWRGARVRQQTSGTDLFTALIGLVGRNKRRYGGYLVHVGVVLMFLGFAGENFKLQETALLTPGKQVTVGDFDIRLDALRESKDARSRRLPRTSLRCATAKRSPSSIRPDGSSAARERRADDGSRDPPLVRRRPVHRDARLRGCAKQSATLEITVTPMINWVWFGFGVIAIGTLIALLPETAFAFAVSRVPANATRAAGTWLILAGRACCRPRCRRRTVRSRSRAPKAAW